MRRRRAKRTMWVRTDEGEVVWVDAAEVSDPEAVREEARAALRREEAARRASGPISFKCPVCKVGITAPRRRAGEKIRCRCGQRMLVPEPPDAPPARIAVECLSCARPHLPSAERCDRCGDMLPVERSCATCGQMWLRRSVCFCPRCGLELDSLGG